MVEEDNVSGEAYVYDHLQSQAEKIKTEKQTRACSFCKKFFTRKHTRFCSACKKASYCGEDCQKADWIAHKAACKLVRPLRGVPGYNDRLKGTKYAHSVLYQHGRRYLSTRQKGAVAFTIFPTEKRELLEQKLAHTHTSASWMEDPVEKVLYHFFILPESTLVEMKGVAGISNAFVDLCQKDRTYRYCVPMIQMNLDYEEPGKKPDVISLMYFAMFPSEFA